MKPKEKAPPGAGRTARVRKKRHHGRSQRSCARFWIFMPPSLRSMHYPKWRTACVSCEQRPMSSRWRVHWQDASPSPIPVMTLMRDGPTTTTRATAAVVTPALLTPAPIITSKRAYACGETPTLGTDPVLVEGFQAFCVGAMLNRGMKSLGTIAGSDSR